MLSSFSTSLQMHLATAAYTCHSPIPSFIRSNGLLAGFRKPLTTCAQTMVISTSACSRFSSTRQVSTPVQEQMFRETPRRCREVHEQVAAKPSERSGKITRHENVRARGMPPLIAVRTPQTQPVSIPIVRTDDRGSDCSPSATYTHRAVLWTQDEHFKKG